LIDRSNDRPALRNIGLATQSQQNTVASQDKLELQMLEMSFKTAFTKLRHLVDLNNSTAH